MKKLLCLIFLCFFIITGCTSSIDKEKNTGLKEYLIYDEKGKNDQYFAPLNFKAKPFTNEEINILNTVEDVYPYYRLNGRSMPYTPSNNDSFWDLYINDKLFYTDAQYHQDHNHMGFPYDIQPYYNDNTIKDVILSRFTGDIRDDLLQVYASDVLMTNLNLPYQSNFTDSYIIDYQIYCPIYDADKENQFDYKMINVKAQIIGVLKTSDGYSTAYMKYNDLMKIIKENNGEHNVPTDTYLLITDNKTKINQIKNLEINRDLIIESRNW